MRFIKVAVSGGSLAVLAMTWAASAGAVPSANLANMLVPHRAVYDLQLDRADEKSGITGLTGRMVYEFNGSACEGYTTNFRFVTRIDMEEQPQRVTDQQTTTFEAGDGNAFRFVNKTFVDKDLVKEVRGDAKLRDQQTIVDLTKPNAEQIDLRLAEFPTRHMKDMIQRAQNGESFYQATLFDGSEDANRVVATTVILGKQQNGSNDETGKMGKLATEQNWPVTIAYFDDKEKQDGLPIYRINFKLYRNGVTRDLMMDYGDFSMQGKLVKLDLFDQVKTSADCTQ